MRMSELGGNFNVWGFSAFFSFKNSLSLLPEKVLKLRRAKVDAYPVIMMNERQWPTFFFFF